MNDLISFALAAFFPRDGDLPGLAELGVSEHVEKLRRDSTPFFWLGVVAAALLFQISPIFTVYRPWPAVFLTEEELDKHAYTLATNRFYLVRQLVVLLKLVAGMFWGQSAEIRATLALPSYAPDPGTRRTEARISTPSLGPRAPGEKLIQIGAREEAKNRGRDHDLRHALDVEAQ